MAKNLNPDVIQLRVVIDGSPARKELAELTQESVALKESLKGMKKGSEEAVAAMARMGEVTKRQEELRKEIGTTSLSLKELNAELGRARAAFSTATPNSEQWVQAKARMDELSEARKNLTDQNRIDMAVWEKVRKQYALSAMTTKQLGMETQRLTTLLANPDLGAQERAALLRQLGQVKDRTEQLTNTNRMAADAWEVQRKGMKLTQMNLQQLGMETDRLKAKLKAMDPADPLLARTQRDLAAVEMRVKTLQSGLGPFGRAWQEVKTQVMSAGAVIGAMFAGGALISGFRSMVKGAAEYSDTLADVRKTTGLSLSVVKELGNEFGKWDTRVPRSELLALARDAGKLGLSAREDITEFVRAGSKIRVALGEDLGDDALKNIGKLVDLFKLKEKFGLEDAMLKVGSAMNELGMASTASEGYMVEFLRRMGGVAPMAKITIEQTLALGATLDSLGQTSEVSTTALSKMFLLMAKNYEQYAKLAGMSAADFKQLMDTDALEAFMRVLENNKAADGITALSDLLGDLGVDGARAVGVLGVLSQNTDRLREQINISNQAFDKGTSITDEYNIKNENLAATLAKLGREFNRLITSNRVVAFMEGLVNASRSAIDWLKRNADAISFMARVLATATAAWVNYRIVGELWARRAAMNIALTRALALAKGLFTGSTISAARATVMFNTALKANPLGLVASLLTTVVGLFFSFGSEVAAATDAQKEHNAQLSETARLLKSISDAGDKTNAATKLTTEQLQAHRDELEALLQQQSTLDATVVAAEENKSAAITAAQERRNAEILKLEEQLRNEQDIRRRFDLQLRLDDLRSEYRKEYDIRRATGQEISASESQRIQADLKQQIAAIDAELDARRKAGTQTVRTLEDIENQIKAIKDRRDKTSTNSSQYQEFTAEIKKLEAERDRITGGESKANVKTKENLDSLIEEYRKFHRDLQFDRLSAEEKELAELDAKHADELAKVKEQQAKLIAAKKLSPEQASADLKGLEDRQMQERLDLLAKRGQERMAELARQNEQVQQLLGEEHNAELQADVDFHAKRVEEGRNANRNVLADAEALKNAQLRLYEQNAKDLLLAESKKWDDLITEARKHMEEFDKAGAAAGVDPNDPGVLADRQNLVDSITTLEQAKVRALKRINDKGRADEREAERNFTAEVRQEHVRRLQNFATIANATNDLVNSIGQYMDASVQAAEQRADADGVRTEEEVANINRLKEERRKAALVAIAVQGATAIANGIAQAMVLPWPANLAAAASSIAVVIGLIAQARAMLNQSSASASAPAAQQGLNAVPLGEQGLLADGSGRVVRAADGGAILDGPRHADDGMAVINPKTGKPVAEVEGGELMLILSRAATRANADLIPAMLKASREGRRMPIMDAPPQINMQRVQQSLRVVHMASGGILGAAPPPPAAGSAAQMEQLMGQMVVLMGAMVRGQEKAVQGLEQFPKNLRATVQLNPQYDREIGKWNDLKQRFKAG